MAHTECFRPRCEKLYLYRGKVEIDDIYVESTLHQYHIDGIRFLYRQFKNENPGVILNNPLGYGNSLQVTLFLGAIKHKLDKPMLILCDEGEENSWLELIKNITDSNNVVVNASDPFIKKSIFINNMNVAEVTRRTWGVVVIDSDALLHMKTVLNKLDADYKIWITPVAMKENLVIFSSIYKWIYPKENFNIEDFKGKPEDRRDIVSKSIQLAAFLKDVVFRTNVQTSFENQYGNNLETRHKTSYKNKDATGTKRKRTKRSIEETELEKPNGKFDASAIKIPRVGNGSSPTDNCSVSEYNNISRNDNCESEVTNMDTKNAELIETLSSKDTIKDYRLEFEDISNGSQENENHFHDKTNTKENQISNYDSIGSTKSYNLPTKDKISIQRDSAVSPASEDDEAYELETQPFINDNNMGINDNDNSNGAQIAENHPCIAKPCNTNKQDSTKIEILAENNHIDTCIERDIINDRREQTNRDNEMEDLQKLNEINKSHEYIANDELQNSKSENKHKALDIDSKITEHEDRIFKKFKGTFLDSIF